MNKVDKIALIIFPIIFIILILAFISIIFIKIPEMTASCKARDMTLYSATRDYYCVDKEGRLYLIK